MKKTISLIVSVFVAFSNSAWAKEGYCTDPCLGLFEDSRDLVARKFTPFMNSEEIGPELQAVIVNESKAISDSFSDAIACYMKESAIQSHENTCDAVLARREWVTDLGAFSGFIGGITRAIKGGYDLQSNGSSVEHSFFLRHLGRVIDNPNGY